MDWEAIGKDFKQTVGRFKGRAKTGGKYFTPGGGPIAEDGMTQKFTDEAKGVQNLNRNSAIGQTHGFLSRSIQAMGGSETVGNVGAGIGMGAIGLGAANGVNNLSYNHPGMGAAAGVVGTAGLVAGALDPAVLGQLARSGLKSVSSATKGKVAEGVHATIGS
jgi:hypothetical protein